MSQNISLLAVDDELEICEILVEYFSNQGFNIESVNDAEQTRHFFQHGIPNLVILDIHMPGEDGLSLARWLREEYPRVGIIMLTTAIDVVDKIIGLEIGADDYVTKPFDLRELLARVKSVLRRQNEIVYQPTSPTHIQIGQCELDLDGHKLYDKDKKELPLTSMEFDLLRVFAENPNRALNRDQIMELAHHKDWDVFDRSIDIRIMRLRRKIEKTPEKPDIIKTVRGVGYMFVK